MTERKRSIIKAVMIGWTAICLILSLLFLTVITLNGAPLDEWVFFALLATLPWIIEAIHRSVR